MKKLVGPIIVLFALLSFAWGQDREPEPIEWIIMPERHHVTKNIHLIIDKSGSMSLSQINRAINKTLDIVSQATDEMNVAVTTFGANHKRLEIVDENCELGPNWMAFPSLEQKENIRVWLRSRASEVNPVQTHLRMPVHEALHEGIRDLTIVVITDCQVNFGELEEITNPLGTPFGIIGIRPYGGHAEEVREILANNENCWFGVIR